MNKTLDIIYEMNDEFEWNVVHEGQLLDAMVGHKPVGVNKYFQMAFICDKFVDHVHKDIDSRKIWTHLETMYNLEALDECESIPFPNSEIEFKLPESEYGNLINKKDEELQLIKTPSEIITPKQVKEVKKEEKIPNKNQKERRDSKEGKDINKTPIAKKEIKKEPEKAKPIAKGRISISSNNESKSGKAKAEDTPKLLKRPTRGSLKTNDDSGSSGKSSPITVTPTTAKRIRRI